MAAPELSLRKIFPAVLIFLIAGCSAPSKDKLIKVLILSGKNNHEWAKTTPVLSRMYNNANQFSSSITNRPDTLKFIDLSRFDVIVSNWNTWPDTSSRLDPSREKDFLKYIKRGGGALFIHAGASSFYGWKDYHTIGIGRWGKNTRHGEQTIGKISGFDEVHPVTKGFKDFYVTDEIWEDPDICRGAKSLAKVTAKDKKDGHEISVNCVFVNQIGKGRSFYTTLGHNERAMLNAGFQALILRATQWAAGREVTINPADEISFKENAARNVLQWNRSDTTLALMKDSIIIWQLNFNNRFGRPYFYPVTVNNSNLTCTSPPDHPWHLGLWFCWKYINGVNYWEYIENHKSEETGFRSQGMTEVKKETTSTRPDFSAEIAMDILYHPPDSEAVLSEIRKLDVSPPGADGSYYIDEDHLFTALSEKTVLDRTPIQTEPGGRSWGGYAGLSIRFSQDYTEPFLIAPDTVNKYRKNKWVYIGFTTLSGGIAGTCIMQDPVLTTSQTSWYIIRTPEVPFFYYSPAALYDGKIVLKKGEKLHLHYRTWIIGGRPSPEDLQEKYNDFVKPHEN